jgi:hypothetical protein
MLLPDKTIYKAFIESCPPIKGLPNGCLLKHTGIKQKE